MLLRYVAYNIYFFYFRSVLLRYCFGNCYTTIDNGYNICSDSFLSHTRYSWPISNIIFLDSFIFFSISFGSKQISFLLLFFLRHDLFTCSYVPWFILFEMIFLSFYFPESVTSFLILICGVLSYLTLFSYYLLICSEIVDNSFDLFYKHIFSSSFLREIPFLTFQNEAKSRKAFLPSQSSPAWG